MCELRAVGLIPVVAVGRPHEVVLLVDKARGFRYDSKLGRPKELVGAAEHNALVALDGTHIIAQPERCLDRILAYVLAHAFVKGDRVYSKIIATDNDRHRKEARERLVCAYLGACTEAVAFRPAFGGSSNSDRHILALADICGKLDHCGHVGGGCDGHLVGTGGGQFGIDNGNTCAEFYFVAGREAKSQSQYGKYCIFLHFCKLRKFSVYRVKIIVYSTIILTL